MPVSCLVCEHNDTIFLFNFAIQNSCGIYTSPAVNSTGQIVRTFRTELLLSSSFCSSLIKGHGYICCACVLRFTGLCGVQLNM